MRKKSPKESRSRKSPKESRSRMSASRNNPKKSRSRKSPKKHTARMTQSQQNKYANRPGPPMPANQHCEEEMEGNDGNMYISRANKNGVCSWKKIN